MKKLLILFVIVAVITGCSKKETNQIDTYPVEATTAQAETVTETESAAETVLIDAPSDYVKSMELADQWASCDDRALAKVMRKARDGEKVTIAVIGGSITQGTISNGSSDKNVGTKKPYAEIFFDWWEQNFPQAEFEFVNAGIGGTDSYLGVHRVSSEVLSKNPDLVLVEFSVNDPDTQFYKRSYDNLVRKILKSEGSPAVMLLFMGQTNGSTAQGSHVFVGFNYKLPMLSYSSLISEMMEQGIYSAKELSGDTVHPSALGHAITGEILWKYLNNVLADVDNFSEPDAFTASPVTKEVYMDAYIADSTNLTPDSLGTFEEKRVCSHFPNGWVCNGEGEFTATMTFRNLGILYYATIDGKSGQYEIIIDGEAVKTIDADFTGGWGNAINAEQVFSSDAAAEHTVTIRKSADSTGEVFDLLGFLVSE